MSDIYITGHRNPDMDSICSALGYAALKNLIDPSNCYVPVRCSHLGEGTKKMLASLEIEAPRYMRDVYPKVSAAYLDALEEVRVKNGLDWALLMITDVIKEQSVLLSTKFRAEKHMPYVRISDGIYDMPGVMSRKKQLLPELIHAVSVI